MKSIIRTSLRERFFCFFAPITLLLAFVPVAHGQETTYNASFANNKEPIAVNVQIGRAHV